MAFSALGNKRMWCKTSSITTITTKSSNQVLCDSYRTHMFVYVHLHLKRKSKKQRKGYRPPPSTSFLCFIFFSLTCSYAHHSSWPRQQEFLKITPQQLYREKMNLYWAAQAMSHNSLMRVSIGISSQVSIKASGRNPITDSKFRNSECRASRDWIVRAF